MLDAPTTHVRIALQCIARVEVLRTNSTVGLPNNLQIEPFRTPLGSTLLLRDSNRFPFSQLEIAMEYTVIVVSDADPRSGFEAMVTMDRYEILDPVERELFADHRHPTGVSAVRTPHFHASITPPILLPASAGNSAAAELVLDRVHFPSHRMELTELVRFLIAEPGVGPQRQDRARVLDRIERTIP